MTDKIQDYSSLHSHTDWYGFDTENDEKGRVTLAALIHESGEKWIWKKAGEFAKWCEDINTTKSQRPMVICHNLEYDLVNEFGKDYPYLQLNYLKGKLISARHGRVHFLDSFNHFRMSLKSLGSALGLEKKEMDIYSEEYVTTDAWICLTAMVRARDYIASLGGKIGATSGSSSVSVWKHMTDSEFCTGPFDNEWLRRGYYGGRTEIFRYKTEGNIRGYDINSMYPFAMMNDFPEYLVEDPKFEKAKGMIECTVSMPTTEFVASLPWRDPTTDRLFYPVGTFTGVWTYDEIRFAEKHNGLKIIKVHKAQGGNSLCRPFDDFILTLYAKRKGSTDESERLFLKVLMNSLYGKIASKNMVTRIVSKYNMLKSGSKRMDEVKWIDHNRGMLDYFTPPQPYVNVCWGAMITAYSRLLLTEYLLKVPYEKLIYCDTDSVYCTDFDFPITNELGGMKLEHTAKVMKVVQPKAYQLDDFYKAKGVPKAKFADDGTLLVDYAREYIETGITHFQAPIRFRASLNSKRGKANEWVGHQKSRNSQYNSKTLSNGRYYPPVIGTQVEMFSASEIKSTNGSFLLTSRDLKTETK